MLVLKEELTSTATKVITVSSGGTSGDGEFGYYGRTYQYKTIGTQTWMIENLAYLPAVSESDVGSDNVPYYYVYGDEGASVYSAKTTDNYSTHGVLYNWETAKTACPTGWHLPTVEEWKVLIDYLANNNFGYGGSDIGKSMSSTSGWSTSSEL